jgi:(p)ppGpp synthase/HD superfamily hydrolase
VEVSQVVNLHIDVEVHDLAHLHNIIAALRAADGVSQVERI